MLDADERVEVGLAADGVVRLGDAEADVEVERGAGAGVVDARVDAVDQAGDRVLALVVRRRPAAEVEAVLGRVDPDVRAEVVVELAVDRVAAGDGDVVVGDRRRCSATWMSNGAPPVPASTVSVMPGAGDRDDVADDEEGVAEVPVSARFLSRRMTGPSPWGISSFT